MRNETLGYIPVDSVLKDMFDDFLDSYINCNSFSDSREQCSLNQKALILAVNSALVYKREYFKKKENTK